MKIPIKKLEVNVSKEALSSLGLRFFLAIYSGWYRVSRVKGFKKDIQAIKTKYQKF